MIKKKKRLPSFVINKTFDKLIKDAEQHNTIAQRIEIEKAKTELKNSNYDKKLTLSEINKMYERQMNYMKVCNEKIDKMRKDKEIEEENYIEELKLKREKSGTNIDIVNRMSEDVQKRRDKIRETIKLQAEKENLKVFFIIKQVVKQIVCS